MRNYFKDTGIPKATKQAHDTGGGILIDFSADGSTTGSIVIVDILASANTIISTGTGGTGTIIAYAPAGASNLSSPLRVPATQDVYSSTGDVTITYYLDN